MSEQGQIKPEENPILMSHIARRRWENIGSGVFLLVIAVACLIGFYSDQMAARVNSLSGAIQGFLWVLAAFLGGFLARGHMDKRLVQ